MELWAALGAGRWPLVALGSGGLCLFSAGAACIRAPHRTCQVVLLSSNGPLSQSHHADLGTRQAGGTAPPCPVCAAIVWLQQRAVGLWLERTRFHVAREHTKVRSELSNTATSNSLPPAQQLHSPAIQSSCPACRACLGALARSLFVFRLPSRAASSKLPSTLTF